MGFIYFYLFDSQYKKFLNFVIQTCPFFIFWREELFCQKPDSESVGFFTFRHNWKLIERPKKLIESPTFFGPKFSEIFFSGRTFFFSKKIFQKKISEKKFSKIFSEKKSFQKKNFRKKVFLWLIFFPTKKKVFFEADLFFLYKNSIRFFGQKKRPKNGQKMGKHGKQGKQAKSELKLRPFLCFLEIY